MCTKPGGVIFKETASEQGSGYHSSAGVSAAISGQHCCQTCVEVWQNDNFDMWISYVPVGNGGDSMQCWCRYGQRNGPEPALAWSGNNMFWTRGICQKQREEKRKKRSIGNYMGERNMMDEHIVDVLGKIPSEDDSSISHLVINKRQAPGVVETDEEIEMRSFGSQLRYECGLGRRFFDTEMEEHYDERWMTCNWNTTWTKYDSLDDCVWIQCINPPPAPEGTGLVSLYEGDAVEFYDNNTYVCQDGLFFEEDRDMPEYNITCLPGGAWDEPIVWPICLASKIINQSKLNPTATLPLNL